MYTRPKLNNWERLFFVSTIPIAVLLAINPWLMLLLSVTVVPVGYVAYWGTRLVRHAVTGRQSIGTPARRFRVSRRHTPLPRIRHDWTVSAIRSPGDDE